MISLLEFAFEREFRYLTGMEEVPFDLFLEVVVEPYSEAHRFYHDVEHISEVVEFLELHKPDRVLGALFWAALWHDVIYDPKRNDNELESARWATRQFQDWARRAWDQNSRISFSGIRSRVFRLIEVTKGHTQTQIEALKEPYLVKEAELLCDADLFRFTGDTRKWNDQIRREYSHVPPDQLREGRKAVLTHYLNRDPFFFTLPRATSDLAKANIRRDLRELEQDSND